MAEEIKIENPINKKEEVEISLQNSLDGSKNKQEVNIQELLDGMKNKQEISLDSVINPKQV